MKENDHSKTRKIHAWLTLAIAAMLPISKRLIPPLVILWVIASFFLFIKQHARNGWQALLAMALYYVCNAVWLFSSEDQASASFALEVKASLFVFPMTWMFLPQVNLRQRLNILLALVWGCISFVVISLVRAVYMYIQTQDAGAFYYADLAWFFHPTYLATYEAMGLVVLGRMQMKKIFALGKPWIHHLAGAVLMVHIGLLSSRAGYLCALLALLLVALQEFRRRRTKIGLVYIISGMGLLALTIMLTPGSQKRIQEVASSQEQLEQAFNEPGEETQVKAKSSSGGRLVAWRSSVEIMLNKPLGVGTGDVTTELMKLYERDGEDYALRKRLNPHNQFLQAGVAFGWTGFLILCAVFFFGFRLALQRRDFLFLSFLLILGLNMLFESFLEVQSGVVFVAFFYGFFVKSPVKEKSSKAKEDHRDDDPPLTV
ncbi:O-antigen ligase family protein [Sanyastnella coralliicola]|uniref:O-antigen ligase family protein n=1 Tax=Sanyastnella coralliicola TaxID=3069118 RepID=UPI0027B8DF2E|nr:O-antigen ligase family protein [Longitalea sp. SCSIO 12813]